MTTKIRVALRGNTTPQEIDQYLPANYSIVGADRNWVFIEGEDDHGWTATEYVVPRLASGLIWAAVVESFDAEVPA